MANERPVFCNQQAMSLECWQCFQIYIERSEWNSLNISNQLNETQTVWNGTYLLNGHCLDRHDSGTSIRWRAAWRSTHWDMWHRSMPTTNLVRRILYAEERIWRTAMSKSDTKHIVAIVELQVLHFAIQMMWPNDVRIPMHRWHSKWSKLIRMQRPGPIGCFEGTARRFRCWSVVPRRWLVLVRI